MVTELGCAWRHVSAQDAASPRTGVSGLPFSSCPPSQIWRTRTSCLKFQREISREALAIRDPMHQASNLGILSGPSAWRTLTGQLTGTPPRCLAAIPHTSRLTSWHEPQISTTLVSSKQLRGVQRPFSRMHLEVTA